MVEVHWTLKVHCWPRHRFNFHRNVQNTLFWYLYPDTWMVSYIHPEKHPYHMVYVPLRETSDYYMSPCKVLWGLDKVFVNTQDHKGRSVWIGLLFSYPQLKCLFGVVGLFLMTVENWISLDYIPLVKGCFLPDSVMRIFSFCQHWTFLVEK